jgi:hypothetical protein
MTKRGLHIVRNTSGESIAGVCTRCNRQFEIPSGELWGNSRDYLMRKFGEHRCETENATTNATRKVVEKLEVT